jgi:eukaryotic-like serine/threonine-protein kinase
MLVGTPSYMAPEQARGGACDERSDLFSLGAVVYRALTGQPPFRGADMPAVLFEVVYCAPPQPSKIAPGLPEAIDLVLAIALAKDPADRFGSARTFRDALADAATGRLAPELQRRATDVLAKLAWGATQTHFNMDSA